MSYDLTIEKAFISRNSKIRNPKSHIIFCYFWVCYFPARLNVGIFSVPRQHVRDPATICPLLWGSHNREAHPPIRQNFLQTGNSASSTEQTDERAYRAYSMGISSLPDSDLSGPSAQALSLSMTAS